MQQQRSKERKKYLEILSNFTNEPLEGEFPDEQLGRLLVATNFTKGNGSRAETMGLFHTSSCSLVMSQIIRLQLKPFIMAFVTAAVFLAAFVASCFRGALPEEQR